MKKTLTLILSLILTLSLILPTHAAYGTWERVNWTVSDGILTVTGGDIPNSTASNAAPWQKFSKSITTLIIGDGVTYIGERAFEDLSSLTSVTFGRTAYIERLAFSGCSSLTEIILPEGVLSVGDFAFAECTSLKNISLPASLIVLPQNAFDTTPALEYITSNSPTFPTTDDGALLQGNTLLRLPENSPVKSLTLPDSVTEIDDGALRDCKNLTSVTMPATTKIGNSAFSGCTALSSLTMPNVAEIGRSAFFGCDSLTEITLPNTLTKIGDAAFKYCTSLKLATFEGNAPQIGAEAFACTHRNFTLAAENKSTGWGDGDTFMDYPLLRHDLYSGAWEGVNWTLNTLTGVLTVTGDGNTPIPSLTTPADSPWYLYRHSVKEITVTSVPEIGANAFRYCTAKTVTVDSTTAKIGDWAFSGCTELLTVTAPAVTEIGDCAFFGDTSLKTAEFGDVTGIGRQAFSTCTSLSLLKTASKKAPITGDYALDGAPVFVLHAPGAEGFKEGIWRDIPTEGYLPGDATGDGKVNLLDVAAIMKKSAGWTVTITKYSSDYTGDGKVNLLDASGVMKLVAGWK